MRLSVSLLACLWLCSAATAADNLLPNGDFEQGLDGWNDFWSRAPSGSATLKTDGARQGSQAVEIQHSGSQDWSFQRTKTLAVSPGEIYELTAWVRMQGDGHLDLSCTLRDQDNKVIGWTYGADQTRATKGNDWKQLRARFAIPPGGATIQPRLTGFKPATVWVDDVRLVRTGQLETTDKADLPPVVKAASDAVEIIFHTDDGRFDLLDRRTQYTWTQHLGGTYVVLEAQAVAGGVDFRLIDPESVQQLQGSLKLDSARPEVVLELSGEGDVNHAFQYPLPVVTSPGDLLIMPVNEGISYPVDDETLGPMHYCLYGGHGLCMGWYGVTDGHRALLYLVETPDDAAVRVSRIDDCLCQLPEWRPQRKQFGPPRRLRYVLFDDGGYVAMCKRYRAYAQQVGLLKTLEEKRKAIPAVDRLVGAVNVWNWDTDSVELCCEMQSLGIDKILYSGGGSPEKLRAMNELGVLTSRYDIYQDAMNPANFPKLCGVSSGWTSEAWANDDLMIDSEGQWVRGWRVEGKDGEWYPCGVLCDRQAVEYAKRRVPKELETKPYLGRFIDTTTASPWRECYHADHPMTRSESRHWKMELLRYMSEGCGLVTGSETGHEAAVPYVHFFEGMMSLGPYRVPDSGRKMIVLWDEVPERVAKFQTGHYYRLPLWELVYHDCMVSYWYWGDFNNKLPSLWDRRDLINALYGTPPMFMFTRQFWKENRDRFVKSYQTAASVARATGYVEMLSHRWLTDDHQVQESQFADGVTVTVNFGEQPYKLPDGTELAPMSHRVEGM